MNENARTYDFMLLITYSMRPDSEARGYDDWLRRVDNPFFNAAACITHYSNWKMAPGPNLFAPHTHFDFLGLAQLDDVDAAINDPELNTFRREWFRLWGVEYPAAPGASIQTCVCTRVATARSAWTDRVAVRVPDAAAPVTADSDVWRVGRQLRGAPFGFDTLAVTFLADGAPAGAAAASIATCIAAPD